MQEQVKGFNLKALKHKLCIDNLHLAFYGASVTQQGRGVVPCLTDVLKSNDKFASVTVSQIGFGSLHLKDATLLFDEVISPLHKKNPIHICFLQWLTEVDADKKDIEYLVSRLLRLNIFPVFLLFYNDNNRHQREIDKSLFYRIATEYELPLIDLDSYFDNSPLFNKKIFRDYTHFTDFGATLVAGLLFTTLFYNNTDILTCIKKVDKKVIFVPFHRSYVEDYDEHKVYFNTLKSTENEYIPKLAHCVKTGEVIKLPIQEGVIAGLWIITGRQAPILKISGKDNHEIMSCWDIWSHFDRFTIRRFSKEWNTKEHLTISITDDVPDYSTCRRDISDWPSERILWILGWSLEVNLD